MVKNTSKIGATMKQVVARLVSSVFWILNARYRKSAPLIIVISHTIILNTWQSGSLAGRYNTYNGQQVLVVVGDAKCAAKRSTTRVVSRRKLVIYSSGENYS